MNWQAIAIGTLVGGLTGLAQNLGSWATSNKRFDWAKMWKRTVAGLVAGFTASIGATQ